MLKVVTLWLLCAILAQGVNVSTKPVMKIRAAVKARQQADNLSPAEPATPIVAAQLQETKKETHENKNVMEMDDDTPVVGDASDGDSQVEVAPEDSNVPVYPEPTASDSSKTSSDSDVSSSFKSKDEDPIDSAVVHLHQDDNNYVNPEDETTVTASSPQSDSNDYAPVKTTHNAIAPGSDTVFVPPSPTEDTVPQSQIVPRSLASAIARSSGQTATTLGNPATAPTSSSTPTDASANNYAAPATTPYPTSATPPTPMTAADQQQQQAAQSQSQSQSNPPTGQTTSPDAEVAPVFQLPSAADVQAAEAQAQIQAQAQAQAAASSATPTSTSPSTPTPTSTSAPTAASAPTPTPTASGASYSAPTPTPTPMASPPVASTSSDSTTTPTPVAGSPTDNNNDAPTMKIIVSDAPPPAAPAASSSTPSTSTPPTTSSPSSSTPPPTAPAVAGPVQQQQSAPVNPDTPAAATPAAPVAPAASAAGPAQDTQAFMAQKLAQAMALEKQRESFEQALHSANPEAARAYFQWQERQTQQAQQEQLQTQMELRNQVLALQDQLFQTQQLLKTNIATVKAPPTPAPAPAVATPPPVPMTVPMRFPSAASGIASRTLTEISVAAANATTVAPQTFFHNSKLIQPPDDTVSIFFFADAYCSGDFTWYAPPQSAMLWSVGSWMSQDHATGTAQSLMVCHNLPGNYQRIFQATVWRAVNFDSNSVDHIFYVYKGQCTCSGQLATDAFPDAGQVGSWNLAQI